MRALASYIMRGRMQAVLVVVITAAFSLMLPPLSYFSGATVAIVTLRHGMPQGGLIIVLATVIIGLLTFFAMGNAALALAFVLVIWLPVWLLAAVLRQSISLVKTMTIAALVGAIVIAIVHLSVSHPATWWSEQVLNPLFNSMMIQSDLGVDQRDALEKTLATLAQVMTGIVTAGIILSAILSLFIARWWQAMLYNPGGFKTEFQSLRFNKPLALVALVIFTLALLNVNGLSGFAKDLSIVLLILYVLQALALVHFAVAAFNANIAWLVVLYLLLLFALPQLTALLALVGLLDTWFNLRNYLPSTSAKND
jgi:hypothetical protein